MILIADSGSTHTTWALVDRDSSDVLYCETPGINPYYQDEDEIVAVLSDEFSMDINQVRKIYFYGAGCANPEKCALVGRALMRFFGICEIDVQSDLMAAARALLGRGSGIAAILGTGSNSCYYDGQKIVSNVPPLGFILGDEGSGAVLGRTLVGDILKKQVPEQICSRFFERYQLSAADILERVYRHPFPNRFLAGFTHFIADNIEEEAMSDLVRKAFAAFFVRNITLYPEATGLPVNFVGSVAYEFRELLKEAAAITGFGVGQIMRSPVAGLIRYHL
jgi:glucosamine kinase